MLKRALVFLSFLVLTVSELGADTRLQFEWSRVLRGTPLTAPLLEGENVYVISQDRQLNIFSTAGRSQQTWGGSMRFYPYLFRGNRAGEVFVVTMDNVIHKLVGSSERWSRHVPFLSGEPALTEEGYLIVPVGKGGIKILYPDEDTEVLSLKADGELVLPVISDPWARFYLATDSKISSLDSWGNKNWELTVSARPIAWLFSATGELVVSLENREVITVSMSGEILARARQDFNVVKLLERADGSFVLINELGRVTLTSASLRPRRTRHFGLFVRSAIVLNKEDLLLLSDRYWITVNKRLEVTQVFKGAREAISANFSPSHVAVVDKNWTLSFFSFKGLPLNQVNYWATDRGDSSYQGRNRSGLMNVNEKDSAFADILDLRKSFSLEKAQKLIQEISVEIKDGEAPEGTRIKQLNLIMQILMAESAKRSNLTGFDIRFDLYDALGKIHAPHSQILLVKYGYWETDARGTLRIFKALRKLEKDPRGLMLDYLFYGIEKFQANRELIGTALDIIEEYYGKSVYLNSKKVNNIFNYVLRQNVSQEFRVRINGLRSQYK